MQYFETCGRIRATRTRCRSVLAGPTLAGVPSIGPQRVQLRASNYTFAEATAFQASPDWIGSHVHTFEFLLGVPELLVADNLKSGVTKSHCYEPDLNTTYQDISYRVNARLNVTGTVVGICNSPASSLSLPSPPCRSNEEASISNGSSEMTITDESSAVTSTGTVYDI